MREDTKRGYRYSFRRKEIPVFIKEKTLCEIDK